MIETVLEPVDSLALVQQIEVARRGIAEGAGSARRPGRIAAFRAAGLGRVPART